MKRLLVIGVILLFLGMSISSTTGFNLKRKSSILSQGGNALHSLDSGIYYVTPPIQNWFKYGIYIKDDVNENVFTKNNISDNVISNCTYGIYVYSYAENNTIYNNDLIDNIDGMYLHYFINNSILNNYVHSNTGYGIYIGSYSDGNIVSRNVCTNNRYGIRFKGVSFNEIFMNKLENNEIGLYSCCGSNDNILYYNTLINNAKQASDGFTNSWDNGIVGNYWDDYIAIHPNATHTNGCWSIPYDVPDGSNKDNFPLINPYI